MTPRPYQRTAIDFLKSRDRGFVHAPAGSGKTVIGACALAESVKDGDSVVWLANTREQVQQAMAALRTAEVDKEVSLEVCCVASQPDTSKANFIVVDECFPAGTLVDGRPIETLQEGDFVTGENGTQNRVVRVFKKQATSLIRVHFTGRSLVCTPDHPILTRLGWKAAISLTRHDEVYTTTRSPVSLCRMQGRPAQRSKDMLHEVPVGTLSPHHAKNSCEIRRGPHTPATSQWNEPSRRAGQNVQSIKSYELEARIQRRKRETATGSPAPAIPSVELGNRSTRAYPRTEGKRVPHLLQSRHSEPGFEISYRSGRKLSLGKRKKSTRRQETKQTRLIRVDRIEVLEPGSDGTFGRLCPKGEVYNLETTPTHTYTANDVVVHNCHHSPAKTWRSLVTDKEARIWGLSATPWSGDPDRDAFLRSTFREFHEIPRAVLVGQGHLEEGKAYIWDIDPEGCFDEDIETRAAPLVNKAVSRFKYLLARADAARRFSKEAEAEGFEEQYREKVQEQQRYVSWRLTQDVLRGNEDRNEWACQKAIEEIAGGQSVLMLVHSIEHGSVLSSRIPGSVVVHSKLPAKQRHSRIEGFKDGTVRCLVATSLADEGLDVPVASRLILVAGGRSANKLEQRAGRVLRPFHGKQGGVIHDFLDRGARLANAQAWARIRTYEALGYEPQIISV